MATVMEFKKVEMKFLILVLFIGHFGFSAKPLKPLKTSSPQVKTDELSTENLEIYNELKTKVQNQPDGIKSELFRKGNKTIEIKSFVSLEGNLEKVKEVLSEPKSYSSWALNSINLSPKGGEYFMQIQDLIWKKETPSTVGVQYTFNFPLFKHQGIRNFEVSTISEKKVFDIIAKNSDQNDPIINSCEGRVKAFSTPIKDRLWVYITGKAILKSWILYEALPERVIGKELGERVYTVLLNYQKREQQLLSKTEPVTN